ncbi:hypothetical protein BCF44_10672 [Kutzneria buriramensis]|uniref:Uncharacterized protein n=2 Tax=Kutzneria buriramensis TaxID=1045776 RepID=A0A3E0HKL0_9PSEU|nr:hypothetical protein BCF44_10672 [Kutzneria buriramensis]
MFPWHVPGLAVRRRLPAAAAGALGMAGYSVVAVSVALTPHDVPVDVLLTLAAAGLTGWWTTVPGALWIGVLGWFFYSGFVTHADGQLGVVGVSDALMAGALLVVAVGAAAVRPLLLRRRARAAQAALSSRGGRRRPVVT